MQVSIEESGSIERKITISVPPETIDSEVSKRLKDVAKRVRIPGFRPGKAPQSVIRKRYEPQVIHEVVSETINSSYMDALGQEKIVPAGLISIDPTPYEPGKDLEFTATIELFPEIPHATLDGSVIEKPVVEVTDSDVDSTLDDIRSRNPKYVAKEGNSEKDDRLTIDFDGKIAGESFPGGNAEDFQFVLGAGQMLEEFDAGLHGASQGDTRNINFTFPENYGSEEVAGKDVDFVVTVKQVEKPEPADLDDEFAKSLGITDGGIDKMKNEIRLNLQRELDNRMQTVMRDKVMDELFAKNQFDIPSALTRDEIDRSVQSMTEQFKSQNLPTDNIDPEHFSEDAEKRVALGLIAREIIQKFEIKIEQEEVRKRVEELSVSYEDSEAYVNWHMSDPERLKQIEAGILEQKIVDRMLETAEVKDQKMSFKEFMNPKTDDEPEK